ncbi:MAG: hypothetical protein HY028_03865 [Gammaproteobacteria bacterium]|nr:hypothetical protein [Gammaproteobacteria bacterium]
MRQILIKFSLILALWMVSFAASAEPAMSEDMAYLFAAARYLNVQKEQGNSILSATAALKARAINRKDFYKALEDSRAGALKEWDETYLKTRKPLVPAARKDLDERIQRSRDLREAACKEWLGQPKKNPLVLKSANKLFYDSMELEQRLLGEVAEALVVATRNKAK